MSRGARRSLIPIDHRDLACWPAPDLATLTRPEQDSFCQRRSAVEMYANGTSFDEIRARTGKTKSEVHRLLKRCLQMAPSGAIQGFHALVHFTRVSGYVREQEIRHTPGSGSGGCAGALSQLLSRLPEISELLDELYFKQNTRDAMPEARMSITAIHDCFKAELRKRGFTSADWPFNTGNCGYKSLWKYFHDRRDAETQRAALSRSGVEAARRSTVGNGMRPLLPTIRPYGAVQLDFHKVDAASVIVLKNDHGVEFEVPLSRWHFGLMVEEKFGAALGFCVALELTPSGDSTLEVVSNALSSQPHDLADVIAASPGDVLINQLMPELAYQGFSILRVDNGWSNAAHEVVNNIISTVGCAINFGPTRAWWRRNLIERIFGELTRRGLQRVPSTYGKGPGDTRTNDPNAQAAKFRIALPELILLFQRCLREHNLEDGEGRQWTSPLKCLQAAYSNANSGFFSQPLPLAVQENPMLMMHVEEVTVRGNIEKNVRPYFNLDRHKHTNETLANAYWLVGMKLIVYVDRRMARIVHATVKDTGEQLGRMRAAGPWEQSDCTWRDRKLMTRSGMAKRYGSGAEDPLELLKQEKIGQLKSLRRSGRLKSSRTALEVAKIGAQQKRAARYRDDNPVSVDEPPSVEPEAIDIGDPFGLNIIPEVGSTVKESP